MKKRRAIQSMLNLSVQVCESIILLKNGHLSTHGKRSIRTVNTCTFDSVFAAISTMYADNTNVKRQIEQLIPNSDWLSMISKAFTDVAKISVQCKALLQQCNIILQSIFKGDDFGNGLVFVDCAANLNYLIPKRIIFILSEEKM